MKISPKGLLLVALFAFVLSACDMPATPTAGFARGFSYIWYVALTGNNSNTCDSPTTPCRTLEGALGKARATNTRVEAEYTGETLTIYHTVNVAAGTYNEVGLHDGYPFARADINVSIIGAGQSTTIFDSASTYGGIFINGDVSVILRDLTIQNVDGSAPDSCVNIRGDAEVTLENVTIRRCVRAGINHSSTGLLTLINVNATENIIDSGGNGNGLSSFGEVTITGGSFSANQGWGIGSSGPLTATGILVERNGREGVFIVRGSATLTEAQIINNGQDRSFRAGLSVNNDADVTMLNGHIDNNQHGIWLHAGNLRLSGTTVNGNPRTAIIVDSGELRLTNVTMEANGSFYTGTSLPGAMAIDDSARAIIRNSQIIGNLNGGIGNNGELFLIESLLSDHSGSWATLFNEASGTAIIERSLIANNQGGESVATGGVAVENRGDMNMINSTVSGNQGAGLINSGLLSLAFSTIAFNDAGGFIGSESSTASPWLLNNIVAGNSTDCYVPRSPASPGAFTLAGTNFDSDGSCGFPDTVALTSLLLDTLADNGGPTFTHALLPGSPAIDAASGDCSPEDQRNVARPFGPSCDSGAYEAGGVALSLEFKLETATPTPEFPTLIVTTDSGCFAGPGLEWPRYSNLPAGTQAEVVGQGWGGGWLVIKHPSINNTNCWIDQDDVEFDIPLDQLRLISIPPKPTATPRPENEPRETAVPTVCYLGPNNQLICQ
jgi:hypothetical protein